MLRVKLSLINWNISSWTLTDGSQGVWLSIGLGGTSMTNVQVIMCEFKFTGLTSDDKFKCYDRYSVTRGTPTDLT